MELNYFFIHFQIFFVIYILILIYRIMKIGTHNGRFHADEVLACTLLKLLPSYANAEIVRTRDESLLKCCDIVVDVGGIFDHKTHRYDHHQKFFCF